MYFWDGRESNPEVLFALDNLRNQAKIAMETILSAVLRGENNGEKAISGR